jgi:hypothetical protein
MFGSSDISNAQSSAGAAINSSGWTVGGGTAEGGQLDTSKGAGLPWYAWASFAIVALAYWRKKKGGK